MRKLYIQEYTSEQYHAGSKARNDCDRILERLGYTPFIMHLYSRSKVIRFFKQIYYSVILFFTVRNYDKCFIQYPYAMRNLFLRHIFFCYKGELECLIHDIITLRNQSLHKVRYELRGLLKKCSRIIVHTPMMKELLIEDVGISPLNIKILYLFDYLTDSKINSPNLDSKEIIFAGNLTKSLFLRHLDNLADTLTFNIYGTPPDDCIQNKSCKYKGRFHPDEVSSLEGSWGLVWDGDSIDTCQGAFGEYLRYNSAHKISLYLVSCKPVIIWERSALRDYIINNHLGIAINSLHEINYKIDSLDDFKKQIMKEKIIDVSEKLRKGAFLMNCLTE